MTIVTPIDGQPALAEHVAQLTQTLTGVRAEPLLLTGGALMTGGGGPFNVLRTRVVSDTAQRFDLRADGGLEWGDGANATDVWLQRAGVALLSLEASFQPDSNNWWELGTTSRRWKKLWVTDADLSGTATLAGDLIRTGADLSNRLVKWQTNGADRWRMGVIDTEAESAGTNIGADLKLQYVADNGTATDMVRIDREQGTWEFNCVGDQGVRILSDGASYYPLVLQRASQAYPTFRIRYNGLLCFVDPTTGSEETLSLYQSGVALRVSTGLQPGGSNGSDLGQASFRWRSAYLGTALSVAGASATANQITLAITTDAQPRLTVDGNGQMKWGPGATTPFDTTLQRTGVGLLRADTHLAIGGATAAWDATRRTVTVNTNGALVGAAGDVALYYNSYFDGTNYRSTKSNDLASRLMLVGGAMQFHSAASVGLGAAQTLFLKWDVASTGQVTFNPDIGTAAIRIGSTPQPKITVAAAAPSSPMTGDVWMW